MTDTASTAITASAATPHMGVVRADDAAIIEVTTLDDGRQRNFLYKRYGESDRSLVAVYDTRDEMYDGLFEAYRDGELLARGEMKPFDHPEKGRVSALQGPYAEYHPRTAAQKKAAEPHGKVSLETQYIGGEEFGFRRAYAPDSEFIASKCGYFTKGHPNLQSSLIVQKQIARQQKIDRLLYIFNVDGREKTEIVEHQVGTARLAVWRTIGNAAPKPSKPS